MSDGEDSREGALYSDTGRTARLRHKGVANRSYLEHVYYGTRRSFDFETDRNGNRPFSKPQSSDIDDRHFLDTKRLIGPESTPSADVAVVFDTS